MDGKKILIAVAVAAIALLAVSQLNSPNDERIRMVCRIDYTTVYEGYVSDYEHTEQYISFRDEDGDKVMLPPRAVCAKLIP